MGCRPTIGRQSTQRSALSRSTGDRRTTNTKTSEEIVEHEADAFVASTPPNPGIAKAPMAIFSPASATTSLR
jgi:hypothetical protein